MRQDLELLGAQHPSCLRQGVPRCLCFNITVLFCPLHLKETHVFQKKTSNAAISSNINILSTKTFRCDERSCSGCNTRHKQLPARPTPKDSSVAMRMGAIKLKLFRSLNSETRNKQLSVQSLLSLFLPQSLQFSSWTSLCFPLSLLHKPGVVTSFF